MNSINLVGNISNDLELKQTTGGKSVVQFNIAVKRPFTKDVTDFIHVILWEQKAEFIHRYAHKGAKIAVSGMLTVREYKDKNGNNRTAYEVIGESVEICESAKSEQKPTAQTPPNPANFQNGNMPTAYSGVNNSQFEEIPNDGDLPF